jgi:PhnB protein
MPIKYIPNGYHSITPYVIIKGASKAIDFYTRCLGAKETMRLSTPDGQVAHAEIRIGDSTLMLTDETPGMGYRSPQSLGGTPVCLMIYVDNVDKTFADTLAAGATVERQVANQFYGDRSGTLKDPFGLIWTIATHVEDVPPDEMSKRAQEFMKQCAQQS